MGGEGGNHHGSPPPQKNIINLLKGWVENTEASRAVVSFFVTVFSGIADNEEVNQRHHINESIAVLIQLLKPANEPHLDLTSVTNMLSMSAFVHIYILFTRRSFLWM